MKSPQSRHCHRTPLLPKLDKLICPAANSERTSAAAVHTLLRRMALQNRNNHLQPFYSIRAVADRFRVPPATISRIYRQLSSERLLRMVWGSKTLLEPVQSSRNIECRSAAIAINLHRFVESPDYRVSILVLQSEMWNHAISEHLLFFEQQADEVVNMCTRNHHPEFDLVVWPWADPLHRHALLRLHDLGIRVVCMCENAIPGVSECHIISPRCTIRTIVRKKILKI